MMSVNPLLNEHYAGLLEGEQSNLFGQDLAWLSSLRAKASEECTKVGFPTLRDEEWRYTNISPIEKSQFSLSDKAGDISDEFL